MTNFRPISILCILSKVLEKLMKDRSERFIIENRILFPNQFGFRREYSTSDAVVQFTDYCCRSLNKKLYTIATFLDFSKAFDTVNKNVLLLKLERMGFRGIMNEWFDSYLSNREMYVLANGTKSQVKTINIGLPQGAVTSPWLISLYINDMHRCSDKLKFLHFADDTTVYMSGNDLERLCVDVENELRKVNEWLNANRLSLNVDKTSFMLFTHSRVDRNSISNRLGNKIIKQVRSVKFLGIYLDDRLNFNDHVSYLSKKLSKTVGIMYKMSCFLPPHILKMLYFSLFYSQLIYCINVWGRCGITITK